MRDTLNTNFISLLILILPGALCSPLQRSPQVVVLLLQSADPGALLGAGDFGLGLLCQRHEVRRMLLVSRIEVAARRELLEPELPNGLE